MLDCTPAEQYDLLSNLIVPRPIAFVSTVGPMGANLAPFSFFAPGGPNPPSLVICIVDAKGGAKKTTLKNIEANGEFVVNLVTRELAEAMNSTGVDYEGNPSKWDISGLSGIESKLVTPERVIQSPVHFECLSYQIVHFGSTSYVIAEVVYAHIDISYVNQNREFQKSIKPIARLGGSEYLDLDGGKVFEMVRPSSSRTPSLSGEQNG